MSLPGVYEPGASVAGWRYITSVAMLSDFRSVGESVHALELETSNDKRCRKSAGARLTVQARALRLRPNAHRPPGRRRELSIVIPHGSSVPMVQVFGFIGAGFRRAVQAGR